MKSLTKSDVWLLRHGKTTGPAALNGQTDACVAPQTQTQITQVLARQNLPYRQVISSPLSRCLDLATRLTDDDKVMIQPDWKEMNFGDFDGVPFEQIPPERWAELEKFWENPVQYPLTGAETLAAFYQRVSACWTRFTGDLQTDTLVVTHGGVIRMILAQVLNLDWRNPALFTRLNIANQSLTHLEVVTGEYDFVTVKSVGVQLAK
ncbi:Putative phosphoserine phosphatase 2 [Vibrio aerogenes CECT 7868]|uniref:Putative phosphoserine phosphatase 2 n=1 Tax=Vibrio aerogenes CECT 7868 TaxID=1216006 RepID=A0A1M5ZUC0_9VIBR|nr:histidine phosphatase family protein [Vibrio aerogenes]SHI27861.1 Putative phosphoserine phosphatase 2 [Vibrio aerogenes CECT 7868]